MEDEIEEGGLELARRFLRTAVVIDDEAFGAGIAHKSPPPTIDPPSRHSKTAKQKDADSDILAPNYRLDAQSIMNAFSELAMICGVVSPDAPNMDTIRQSDIVVLDWRMRDDDPNYTLELLRKLLTCDQGKNSLRLVAIYTGEALLEEIREKVFELLKSCNLGPKRCEKQPATVPFRHGRLELYAKSKVNLAKHLQARSVSERKLPECLVKDFAKMMDGLLPHIALTALTAVREGEHKLLDRFRARLDPAFLTHMVCLPDPSEAEHQMVAHITEELRGLVGESVSEKSPAGIEAAVNWVRRDPRPTFTFDEKTLCKSQTIDLVKGGLSKFNKLKDRQFKELSAGFSSNGIDGIDEQLAWIMSFRTVYSAPSPTLWLGTVVTSKKESEDGDERHLICMRPRCDSVRLDKATTFIFLPLVEPRKNIKTQLVVKLGDTFKRLGMELDSALLRQIAFEPSAERRAVIAKGSPAGGEFIFTDVNNRSYVWRGELKAEYSQWMASTFANALSRPARDESEWLRRTRR